MEIEYNRLFGVLAVQHAKVDQARLDDLWRRWQAQPEAPFSDFLIDQGAISAEQREQIDNLLSAVANFDADGEKTPSPADQTDRWDSGSGTGKVTVKGQTEHGESQTSDDRPGRLLPLETVDMPVEQRDRYTLTRVHGQGGLGRVWLALDRHLNREVALKELRPDRKVDHDAQQRFVREAQVTGQLEHPHIVPLYEMSRHPETDMPFYTMRFQRGRTLRNSIDVYHDKKAQGKSSPVELRQLLNYFVSICHAVAYAASRQVVHRDIKPSNIMLGDFGEVVLLDWGLAKLTDQEVDDGEAPLQIAERDQETKLGEALGTPAYMAPEQALGRRHLIDGRTDIYGLGAVLFSILTGKGPHAAATEASLKNTTELLKWITDHPTPAARKSDPSAPPALEAICAKAMASHRDDRYQSATELADDVNRWLADEPVSVYRDPWRDRLARWMRRNQSRAQAGAVTLVLVALVAVIAALLVNRARRAEAEARSTAESALAAEQQALAAETEARAEALRRFRQARRTLDRSIVGVSNVLRYYPGVQQLRKRLLEEAAADYRKFAEEKSDDPELMAESGRALIRLGDVYDLMADYKQAQESYRSAEQLFEDLVSAAPDREDFARELANSRTKIAVVQMTLGINDKAAAAFQTAVASLDKLVEQSPEDADHRDSLAAALINYALLLDDTQKHGEALAAIERSEREYARLSEANATPDYKLKLARTRTTIGQILANLTRYREAVSQLTNALAVYDRLNVEHPDEPDYLEAQANCLISLGNARRLLGQDEFEEQAYRAAISKYELLVKVRPDIADYHESLALTRTDLAQVLRGMNRTAGAQEQLLQALELFNGLRDSVRPIPPRYHEEVGVCQTTMGQLHYDLDENTEAELHLLAAVQLFEGLVQLYDEPQYRRRLAISLSNMGRLQTKTRQFDEAKKSFLAAINRFGNEEDDYSRDGLAWCFTYLGDLLHQRDEKQEAATFYRKALAIRKELDRTPDHLYNHALLLATCLDPELRNSDQAIDVAIRATELVADNHHYIAVLGAAHFVAEDWSGSISYLAKARENTNRPDPFTLFHLAMAHWQSDDKEVSEKFNEQALRAMKKYTPGRLELIWLRDTTAKMLGKEASGEGDDAESGDNKPRDPD
jgi:serine/threonine protein kinase/tetratricopeptide (TPR) repeat protein